MKYLLVFGLLISSLFSAAQIPYRLTYDPILNEGTGAENLISFNKSVYALEDRLLPLRLSSENTLLKKGVGMSYRFAKLVLLDLQFDYTTALVQHEVFGHGARYREAGYRNNSYRLSFAPPLGSGSGSASAGSLDPDILISAYQFNLNIFGGNEANLVLSKNLQARVLLKDQLHYREALLYLVTKNNLAWYIWLDKLSDFGGDIRSYVFSINNLPSERPDFYDINRLARQSLISLLNPFQLYAAFALSKNYLLEGQSSLSNIPAIRIKNLRWLPSISYNLAPFGSEFYLDHHLIINRKLYHLRLGLGDRLRNDFYRLGLKNYGIINSSEFFVSSGLNVWRQPAFTIGGKGLSDFTNVPAGLGCMLNVDADWFPLSEAENFGISTRITYKTKGYVQGEALDSGFFFRIGLSYRANPQK